MTNIRSSTTAIFTGIFLTNTIFSNIKITNSYSYYGGFYIRTSSFTMENIILSKMKS